MSHFLFNNHTQSNKNLITAFFCLLTGFLFFTSCSNYHCKEPMYVPLAVSFYSDVDTSQQVKFIFLKIQGIGSDSIRNASERNSEDSLSLKKFENSTGFVFTSTYKNEREELISVVDTLTIRHTNTQEFVSAECGCRTTFRLEEVWHTRHNITDAIITKKSVTSNYNEKHIRIYFENY